MKCFYTPDGHRRYVEREGCSLNEAYRRGYRVLIDEIVKPSLLKDYVEELGIFLLSSLNLERRESSDLSILLTMADELIASLVEECRPYASIKTVGTYLRPNLCVRSATRKQLTLYVGTRITDDCADEEVDMFLRSGGEMRLSGAPRLLIGDYTQFYTIPAWHPDVRFADINACFQLYRKRYMREPSS